MDPNWIQIGSKLDHPIHPIPDPGDNCDGPECCSGHVGVEYGGVVQAKSFLASTENTTSTLAAYGRLNKPYLPGRVGHGPRGE